MSIQGNNEKNIETLSGLFAKIAANQTLADKPALTAFHNADDFGDCSSWTCADFARDIGRTARLLARLGLSRSDHLALLLPNIAEYHLLLWGGMDVCGIAPINPLLRAEHISHLLSALDAKLLAHPARSVDPQLWATAQNLSERFGISLLEVGGDAGFSSLLTPELDSDEIAPRLADDVAALFHTGGTTGRPKIAALSLANIRAMATMLRERIDFGTQDTFVTPLPLFHIAGAVFGGLTPFLSGTHVVMPPPPGLRDIAVQKQFWRLIEHVEATMMVAVPTSLAALTAIPVTADISSLDYVVTGTSTITMETAKRFIAHSGKEIHVGYGMTETSGGIAYSPRRSPSRLGTVGPPLPGLEVRVAALTSSDPVLLGENGRVLVRGPNVFSGYLDGASPIDPEGWLDSGDLGFLSPDGWLTLTGRSKDLIIRSGHNIDPAIIEEVAETHPAVAVSAAVGEIDEYAGEIPALYVELKVECDQRIVIEELAELLKQSISEPPARPRNIYVIDRLPLTAVGKIYKPALRIDAARRRIMSVLRTHGVDLPDSSLQIDVAESGRMLVNVIPADKSPHIDISAALHDIALFDVEVKCNGQALDRLPNFQSNSDTGPPV